MSHTFRLQLLGQHLEMLPQRAIFWEEASTLLVADTHWGKGASFRAAGLPVPGGTTAEGVRRLERAVEARPIRRIVFLGDFLHAREGRAPATLETLRRWREGRPELSLVLVRGNHDRHAGDPPPELEIDCVSPPLLEGPFAFLHHPRSLAGAYGIGGHIHPAVRLVGRGKQRQRLPCFWFREGSAVLPAFGEFTGAGIVDPDPDQRVFVIAGDSVIEVNHPSRRK